MGYDRSRRIPRSPIVKHRNKILDLAAHHHDLRLVIAVGTAAKESVATWIRAHGGTADPHQLHEADAHVGQARTPRDRRAPSRQRRERRERGRDHRRLQDRARAHPHLDKLRTRVGSHPTVTARATRLRTSSIATRRSRSATFRSAAHGGSDSVRRRATVVTGSKHPAVLG